MKVTKTSIRSSFLTIKSLNFGKLRSNNLTMMKKQLLFIILTFFYSVSLFGQAATNSTVKFFQLEYERVMRSTNERDFQNFVRDFDLLKINNEYYIGVLGLVDENLIDEGQLIELNIFNDTKIQDLWTFRVPINALNDFLNVSGVKYIEIGEPVSPDLEEALPSTRADSVHAGLGGLLESYSGKDVIVAVIDWGFDYTHPIFYDSTQSHLRISKAWDQNKFVGNPPAGYNFGVEYSGQNELLAAGSDTNYVFGYSSHGTHVAGIAGGAGAGKQFTGSAPEAELICISLRRDAPSLIDAFSYVINYAASVNKPCVFNMSFGSHLGPHDGTSLKNYGIDILHGPGKIFVGSAGNNGRSNDIFHLDYDFSQNPNDTMSTTVQFQSLDDQFGQTLSMWGSENSSFGVAVELASNGPATIHKTDFYFSSNEPTFIDTLLFDNDTLIIRMQSTASFFLNGKPNIRLELKNTTPHRVILHATSGDSHLHIWNNVRMNNRYTNWGVPLSSLHPGTIMGNNDYGLGEPAGVGRNVITVASYRAESEAPNGTPLFGNISDFSSRGPTVDGRTKPDIASTGQAVWSSVNSYDITQNQSQQIEFNGRTYGFASFSGTSMSGPMVAGIVALMLEAHPNLSATQAKEILKSTARLDERTGEIGTEGHLQWGWGKANALAAVKAAETVASVDNITIQEDLFTCYPNPASSFLTIELNSENGNLIEEVELFQIDGKASKHFASISNTEAQIDVSSLPNGAYILKVRTATNFEMKRIIISK